MSIWPKYRLCALTMVRHQYFPTGGVPGIFYASNLVSPSGPARPQRLVAWTGRHALVCLMWPCCHAIGGMADWATPRLTVWPTYRSGHTTSQSPLTHILRPPTQRTACPRPICDAVFILMPPFASVLCHPRSPLHRLSNGTVSLPLSSSSLIRLHYVTAGCHGVSCHSPPPPF
jgi:hypothetical protein